MVALSNIGVTSRRSVALGLLVASVVALRVRPASAFQLVSHDEAEQSVQSALQRGLPLHKPRTRSLIVSLPRIEVVSPSVDRPVPSPVNIRLRFLPEDGAVILPDTFKVAYGWLGLDITDRIRQHATITADGLVADNAELPKGTHDLTLSVSDSSNHKTKLEMSVTIQ